MTAGDQLPAATDEPTIRVVLTHIVALFRPADLHVASRNPWRAVRCDYLRNIEEFMAKARGIVGQLHLNSLAGSTQT